MEDINLKIISLDKRINNIEEVMQTQILQLACEHTELLQKISEKLKLHDEMFVEIANNLRDIASNALVNSNTSIEYSEHIANLYNSTSDINNSITEIYKSITVIYKDLTSIYDKLSTL
jgi:uncharacterized coiled-coil DUF342 family protein